MHQTWHECNSVYACYAGLYYDVCNATSSAHKYIHIYDLYVIDVYIFTCVSISFSFYFYTMLTTSDDAIGLMLKDIYSSIIETNAYAKQAS